MSAEGQFDLEDPGASGAGPRPAVRSRPGTPETPLTLPDTLPPPDPSAWQRLAYVVGGLCVAGMILVFFNPYFGTWDIEFGFDTRLWPWRMFQEHRAAGGAFQFPWHEPQVFILTSAAFTLMFFVAALKAPGPGRGMLALAAVVLGS